MDKLNENSEIPFRTKILGYVCQDGEIGRHARLKLSWTVKRPYGFDSRSWYKIY